MKNDQDRSIDRLILFMKSNGICPGSFEKNVGLSNGYISKQLRHKGSIGSNILQKIKNRYDSIDLNWIITGKSEISTNRNLKKNHKS